MTTTEVRRQAKLTAINKIREIYHTNHWDVRNAEQRDDKVRYIIGELEKELKAIKPEKNTPDVDMRLQGVGC